MIKVDDDALYPTMRRTSDQDVDFFSRLNTGDRTWALLNLIFELDNQMPAVDPDTDYNIDQMRDDLDSLRNELRDELKAVRSRLTVLERGK